MKHCFLCNAEIPNPLNEFGDVTEPVCQMCWLEMADDNLRYFNQLRDEQFDLRIELWVLQERLSNLEVDPEFNAGEIEYVDQQIALIEEKLVGHSVAMATG